MGFQEIWYLSIFWKSVEKIPGSLKADKNNGYLTWRPIHFFLIISRTILLRMRNVSDKPCTENQNTHFTFNIFFFSKIVPFNRIMCKSIIDSDRTQITTWRTRTGCCIPKATDTHSEYVIFTTFPLQQWLYERVAMLRHTHMACLVLFDLGKHDWNCSDVACCGSFTDSVSCISHNYPANLQQPYPDNSILRCWTIHDNRAAKQIASNVSFTNAAVTTRCWKEHFDPRQRKYRSHEVVTNVTRTCTMRTFSQILSAWPHQRMEDGTDM